MPRQLLTFFLVTGCLIPLSLATHPFSIDDMLRMKRIGDPQVSPTGEMIVFVLRTTDLEANRGRTDLWLVQKDGSGLRRLTTHESSESNPRWSPSGDRIWFLSSRSGSSQAWSIAVAGGEARQETDLSLDVGNLVLSSNGSLAFSMDVFPDCVDLACTDERLAAEKGRPTTGRAYDRLFVRHWDTWSDGRRSHVFSMSPGGVPVDLMKGMDADSPSKPFGGPEEVTFTPDGRSVVFTARDAGHSEPWSTNFDLYVSPVDGSVPPRNLTETNTAWDTGPAFSPDGKTLAYLSMSRPGFEADRFRIVLRDWPGGGEKVLRTTIQASDTTKKDWDRSPGGLTWTTDGTALLATAQNVGQRSLFSVDVRSGSVTTIVKNGYVGSPSPMAERILFGHDDLKSPVELKSVRSDGSDLTSVTSINAETVADAEMGDFEQFSFDGWNGEKVHGFIVKPVRFNPARKYPVAFLIHGGPQGSFGNHFHYRWNPQAYAGAGYAAVMIDFHGSTGYGQAFTDSISGDWGGKPFVDLKKGLEATLRKYPWLDGDRVGALGASYGGYMINWIAGNWPERFRCFVNHDGIFDNRMMYYATEELWFPEWEHGGPYWRNPAGFEKHNPVDYVERWKTPTLVVHGGQDHRVPLEQGLGTFTALQRLGVPSRFLYFPDENHWILSPQNSVQWHQEVIAWLDQWLKPGQ